mmetsp:Transcript_102273/g.284920  ORF Transcript_102273/g.284920 Transcript_102273/m.284920 type:complete len:314 (+) Transcript_102273:148-1089(+)
MGAQCLRSVEEVQCDAASTSVASLCTRPLKQNDVTALRRVNERNPSCGKSLRRHPLSDEEEEQLPVDQPRAWPSRWMVQREPACAAWPLMGTAVSLPRSGSGAAEVVTLHVYHVGNGRISQAVNTVLQPLGTGLFHCGVEAYGCEWSFSDTASGKGDGVFSSKPRRCAGHVFCQSVDMGETFLSEDDVLNLVDDLKEDWPVHKYHILRCNCCHFCDEFCKRLGVGAIPTFLTSLAGAGRAIASPGEVSCYRQARQAARCISEGTCCGPHSAPAAASEEAKVEVVEVQQLPVLDPLSKVIEPNPRPPQKTSFTI